MTMKHPAYTEGERVRLRPAVMSDRGQIYDALARSELSDVLMGPPSPPGLHTSVIYRSLMRTFIEEGRS